jgi:hypothetical protein
MTTTHDGAHETNSQARDISGTGKFQLSLNIFKGFTSNSIYFFVNQQRAES